MCHYLIKNTECFLSQFFTMDECWIRHFDPETKRQIFEADERRSEEEVLSTTKKIYGSAISWEDHGPVFWDTKTILMILLLGSQRYHHRTIAFPTDFEIALCN